MDRGMRGSIKLSLSLLGLLVASSGCTKEPLPPCTSVPLPYECPEPAPRYADVAPIIDKYCSRCHYRDATGGLFSLTDYEHAATWQTNIAREVGFCAMPPPEERLDITVADRTTIVNWVRCGALP
jgi:hypothetical protein